MFMLMNLKSVDHVIVFSEETPFELIQELKPNILVKGGDWKPEQIVGSDIVLANGGEVKSLKFIDGHSTSTLISKVQGLSLIHI